MEKITISVSSLRNVKGVGSACVQRIVEQSRRDAEVEGEQEKALAKEPPHSLQIATESLYNGESVSFMRENIPNDCVDLVVTSPPYDDLRLYGGYHFNYQAMLSEIYRVLTPGGVCVWVVGDATVDGGETGTSFKQALYAKEEVGFVLHDTMIYAKDSPSYPSNQKSNRCSQVFEYMFILSKGKPKTTNLLCDRKNKCGGQKTRNVVSVRYADGVLRDARQYVVPEHGIRYNIWEIPTGYTKSAKDDIAYEHPAIFPEQLVRDHIRTWTNDGDLVLDPMCGSGTTCLVAKELNRAYIGIDINPEYINNIAKKRI